MPAPNAHRRRIVVTTALPYANGDIHIGHLFEHFITDFWVRFQKMRGNFCLSICADDTHGTPIMVAARKRGITPETLIAETFAAHQRDFASFDINFDHYSSTNSDINRALCHEVYQQMQDAGHVEVRGVRQSYCENDKMFLPDRFVRGSCPACNAPDQYGDQCEVCSATYSPIDMLDGKCALCGETPVTRESDQHFFKLDHFRDFLKQWVRDGVDTEIVRKLDEWLQDKLKDWCISRDEPYFGFEIPEQQGKYFYVWVDAPLGYVATTKEWCQQHEQDFDRFWKDGNTEIYHNIGKDIVYFHALFWPAMLKTAGFTLPRRIFVHGMLTSEGEKLSKSRGTFIRAATWRKHLDPEWLRYYLAAKINGKISDVDFSFDDFRTRVNSDLIGKITNVASRGAQLLQKKLDRRLGNLPADGRTLVAQAAAQGETIAAHYEKRDFSKAVLAIRAIVDEANRYCNDAVPWETIKSDPERTRGTITTMLNLFRIATVYLKPILPSYSTRVEKLFAETQPFTWTSAQEICEQRTLNDFKPLLTRVEAAAVTRMCEETKAEQKAEQQA